jgi:hypothetical protein
MSANVIRLPASHDSRLSHTRVLIWKSDGYIRNAIRALALIRFSPNVSLAAANTLCSVRNEIFRSAGPYVKVASRNPFAVSFSDLEAR